MSTYISMDTPALKDAESLASNFKLENHGILYPGRVYWNLPAPALIEEFIFRGEGKIADGGPFLVNTGKWTGRAVNAKFLVKESSTEKNIDWGEYNRSLSQSHFDGILQKVQAYLQGTDLFVQDVYVGADPNFTVPIRIITCLAWQSLFAHNIFITHNSPSKCRKFVPEFTIIAAPTFKVNPKLDGTTSETVVALDFSRRTAVIANTSYAGEIKKTVFTIMNYLMPLRNVMSMHCSANVGKKGDVALFFGLSGTGKTTLSADPKRFLIGDDEHGWSDDGIFNYENGCYAKVIRLSKDHEPDIYESTHRFGTILENVVFDPVTRKIDLDDNHFTENTRACYPLDFISNAVPEKMVKKNPENIIFLTADAQGVLPPVARLNPQQAVYHFLSGYTSKIAGTELGLGNEPSITFSTCFGAPFMVHHPDLYAKILEEKIKKHKAQVWIVNTGWIGGAYGVGSRISIAYTRQILDAILEGKLNSQEYRKDRCFGFEIPKSCPGLPKEILQPEKAWFNKDEYWDRYNNLVTRFKENFKKYSAIVTDEVIAAGPKTV